MPTRTHDQNTLLHGSWNAICDVCGFKYKAVDLKKRWDGLMVCKEDWEPRHPSDSFRVPPESTGVAWARTDSTYPNAASSSPPQSTFIDDSTFQPNSRAYVYGDQNGTGAAPLTNTIDRDYDIPNTIIFNVALTADRTLALADIVGIGSDEVGAGGWWCIIDVYRTGGGAGSLTVTQDLRSPSTLKVIPANVNALLRVGKRNKFSAFEVISYTTLGI